jgi:hypothetical protein
MATTSQIRKHLRLKWDIEPDALLVYELALADIRCAMVREIESYKGDEWPQQTTAARWVEVFGERKGAHAETV